MGDLPGSPEPRALAFRGPRYLALLVGSYVAVYSVVTLLRGDGTMWTSIWTIGCGGLGAVTAVRGWPSRLLVTSQGLTVRNVFWTHVLAWEDVGEITSGGMWRPTALRIRTTRGRRIYVDAVWSIMGGSTAGHRQVTAIAQQLSDLVAGHTTR